jgi:hypothetical protein
MHRSEPLVPGPSHLEVEISIAKLKKYNPPGSDQIQAELYQAGGDTLVSEIHKLVTSIWNKEELPDLWKESIIVLIHKTGKKLAVIINRGISLLSPTCRILLKILLSRMSPYTDGNFFGTMSVDIDVTNQQLIRFFAFVRYWKKNWEYNETVHQLFIDFKKAYDSLRRDVLYNILIEFRIPMNLVWIIKMCLNET